LRLQAEFDNYRKRSLQEKAEFIKFANQGLISELIGIVDNFELSIKYADKKNDFKLMHQGVDMIIKQLHTLLKSKGLEKIKTVGENFNPHQHDALEIIEDQDVEVDTVIEELQPGYLLSGRILRPAKVKVAKPKKEVSQEQKKGNEKKGNEEKRTEKNKEE
jgi:molecular chaperone GrpE